MAWSKHVPIPRTDSRAVEEPSMPASSRSTRAMRVTKMPVTGHFSLAHSFVGGNQRPTVRSAKLFS